MESTHSLTSYWYDLPTDRIAQKSAVPRDHSRLCALSLADKSIADLHFFDIASLLKKGDLIVMNNSKVIPARLKGVKETGGSAEVFLVRKESGKRWSALLKKIKARDIGKRIFCSPDKSFFVVPREKLSDGTWLVDLSLSGKRLFQSIVRYGVAPTPPYVKTAMRLSRYQTVYAKKEGSVAAPTAGFHFTKKQIDSLKNKGVLFTEVTLHVGPGTFLPLRTDDIRQHTMHGEYAELSKRSARAINQARRERRRIIAVGTTSVRVLEGFADENGHVEPGKKDITLYIYPGYRFKLVDALLTNFHLPESTLLVLVCAFAEFKAKGTAQFIMSCYTRAVKKGYRFYSFGDCMFIE